MIMSACVRYVYINSYYEYVITLHQFMIIEFSVHCFQGWPGARNIKEKSVANINESIHTMVKTQDGEDSRWFRLFKIEA